MYFRLLVGLGSVLICSALLAEPFTLESILKQLPNAESSIQENIKAEPIPHLREMIIRNIKIVGLKNIPEKVIRNAITIPIGEKTNNFRVAKKLKILSKMGVFESVQHEIDETQTLTITLKENPIVKSIGFEGNKTVPSETLSEIVTITKGKVLNKKKLRKDIMVIQDYYDEQGYALAKVQSVATDLEGNVVYGVSEGIIEVIEISGNMKTQDYVIRRELESKIDQAFHGPTFKEDMRRIFNLSYFLGLDQEFLTGSEPGLYKLRILVNEKPSNATVSFGGTYQAISGLSFFSNFFWDNLFGHGQTLLLNGQFGEATVYQFKYVNPWMWGDRKSLSLKAWRRRGSVDATIGALGGSNSQIGLKREEADGGEIGFGIPISYELRTHHFFRTEDVRLTDYDNYFYTKQSYRFTIALDNRDNFMNPTSGKHQSLSIEKGYPFFATSLDFTKVDVSLAQFFQVQENQVLATKLSFGYLDSPDINREGVFNREFYRIGGSYTVRGFKDFEPYAIGSRSIVVNIEYRFLLGDSLQFIVFTDAGLASNTNKISLEEGRMTTGLGLRFVIPALGPIRLDWGIPKLDSLDSTIVHFNIGHTF